MKCLAAAPLLVLFALLAPAGHAAAREPFVLHVAPNGDDESAGTKDAPFASMHRALEVMRAARAAAPEMAAERDAIRVAPGVYYLEAPLELGPEDRMLELRAEGPGGTVTLRGGRPITGWVRGEQNRWSVLLPEVREGRWHFRQLWKNGERMTRARFPNGGEVMELREVRDDARTFVLDREVPGGNLAGQDAELVVIQNWSIARVAVEESGGENLRTKSPAGWIGHDACTASAGKPAFLEHAMAFLDTPGEWHLDRATGVLTYQGAEGEDPNVHEFIAPVLEQWLVAADVEDVVVDGIVFEYAAWPLPETGYQGIQAGHFGASMRAPVSVLPGAVHLDRTAGCQFTRCTFRHTGASALVLGPGCRRNAIRGCTLDDVGGNGVMFGWRGGLFARVGKEGDHSLAADWPAPEMVPADNTIADCTLTRAGAQFWGAVGIYDAFCHGTRIEGNLVHDMPYTGISIGFRWDESETSQRECRVLRNHVYDVMKKLADGGAIYTLGLQPGSVIAGNLLHDVHRSAYAHGGAPNNGIFFDQGSKGYTVAENIIYNTSGDPIRFNQTGPENLRFEDNHFGVAPGDPGYPEPLAREAGKAPRGKSGGE